MVNIVWIIFLLPMLSCVQDIRGNNIDLKTSTLNCSEFLVKQIEIIKPKVVFTLGYYPLLSLSRSYHFVIDNTLRSTIIMSPEIKLDDFIIIPLYHPVAQISKTIQLEQYKRIWRYI